VTTAISQNLLEAKQAIIRCESTARLKTLLRYKNSVTMEEWLTLLGSNWQVCDDIWENCKELLTDSPVARRSGPIREMMTAQEYNELKLLISDETSHIDIYRGCYANLNEDGICYSLDRKIATNILLKNRYYRPDCQPVLLWAMVCWEDVIALKLDRNEREIIVRRCDLIEQIELSWQ
jgi:hypothetical protein